MSSRHYKWVALGVLFALWSAAVFYGMSQTFWQTGANFVTALMVGAILLVFGIAVVWGVHFRGRKFALGVGVAFSPIVAGLVGWQWMTWQQEERSKEIVLTIVPAIERFRSERGRLPATLSELVPKYLPAVPKSAMKLRARDFIYGYDQAQSRYWLGFKYADWKMSTWDYDSKSKQWTWMPSS